jgi:hypothetical protein
MMMIKSAAIAALAVALFSDRAVAEPAPLFSPDVSVQLGGGVTAFASQDARAVFHTGGYWDLRGVLGSGGYLGGELGYVGSARNVSGTGLTGDAQLLGDSAEAVLRANLPLSLGVLRLEPFLFGGAGFAHYQVVNQQHDLSGVRQHDNAFALPFGAGLGLARDHVTFDARFTYREVFAQRLLTTESGRQADLRNWSIGAMVGYEI